MLLSLTTWHSAKLFSMVLSDSMYSERSVAFSGNGRRWNGTLWKVRSWLLALLKASIASNKSSNFSRDEEEMITVGRVRVGPFLFGWPEIVPSRRP